ncbi:hypothetical protein ACE10Z_23675 [Bradyrhizobium sp. Pha-3]|uniref:hypothetical protein n=1 Tax=Bradyrhizobium sp. Pha-3 TaxID=208375 RepID=UPI0035D525EC
MPLDTTGTILTMTNVADGSSLVPFYSARGITQTLEPIDGSMYQMRTVNGELIDLSVPRFRKFRSVISARDVRPPSRDDIWPGAKVVVGCAYLLSYPTIGGSPSRTPVSGSQIVEGSFTFYQPQITFMIGKPTGSFEEWEAGYAWSIPLEEV